MSVVGAAKRGTGEGKEEEVGFAKGAMGEVRSGKGVRGDWRGSQCFAEKREEE